jgi:carboxyl-terminal processing protease
MDLPQTESPQPENNAWQPTLPRPKNHRRLITILAVIVIIAASFRLGYVSGEKGIVLDTKNYKIVNQQGQPTTVDYSLLWAALQVAGDNYIDKASVDQQKIMYGAVKGAVGAIGDPYTEFFTPQELANFRTELSGKFGGIGAEVGKKDGNLVVIAPLDGTPAKKAGLLPKDIIAAIDGQSTADMSVDDGVTKIRGEKGTTVTLTIVRSGRTQPFDVKIVRDTIDVKSVKWSYQTVNGKAIATLTVSRFGDDTADLLTRAINDIVSHRVQGIVLDLRDDPGGYLTGAVATASEWVPKDKLIVTEAHSNGTSIPYNSSGSDKFAGIKTVVLINGGSASAAEILAGALHDHGIAQLIGEKSFGKGSVQQLFDLPGGSAVKVTIAKWITPNGKNLNKDGLEPDVPVKRTEEDVAQSKDPQLDRALQEVTK